MTSWSAVAAGPGGLHGGHGEVVPRRDETTVVGDGQSVVAEGKGQGHTSRQSSSSHLALLQQALKSREDAVSGARWCLGCGKRFMDVFKLAQHIKDRHSGVNGPDGEFRVGQGAGSSGVGARVVAGSSSRLERAGGGAPGGAVSMGDYLGTLGGGTGDDSRLSARNVQKTLGSGPRGVQQRQQGLSRKQPHGGERKKALSSLKKKYVREKRNAMRAAWDGVRVSLEENIGLVEAFVEDLGCGKDGMDWWSLDGQVRWYRGHLAARFLEELRVMQVLCMGKLKTLEDQVARGGRRGGGRDRGGEHKVGVGGRDLVGEERAQGEEHDQGRIHQQQEVERGQDGGPLVELAAEDNGVVHEKGVDERNEGGVYDSFGDDDSDSSASDDSFDLQWGDTLQTWAHSLGHASLKSLSRAEEETLVHQQDAPVVLDVELPASKARGRKYDVASGGAGAEGVGKDADGAHEGGIRVVINATGAGRGVDGDAGPMDGAPIVGMSPEDPIVPWHEEFCASVNTATAPIYCAVCHDRRVFAWDEHLASPEHERRLATLARQHCGDLPLSMKSAPLTKNHHLSVEPKRYVGEAADVEPYVTHVITEDLNAKVVALLSKLISWQTRTKEIDPMNARRKKRLLCGMREVGKAVRLGKVRGLVVAPNVQPLSCAGHAESHVIGQKSANGDRNGDGDPGADGDGTSGVTAPLGYPTDGIIEAACAHDVPVVFALTRRKMGKLLGQKKTVSVFALINIQGAEQEFDDVFSQRLQ